jgi:hypothetical protein
MRHGTHRTVLEVVQEMRLPAPERAAARSERQVEAQMRRERDNEHSAERRAARAEAEAWRDRGWGSTL